MHAPLKAVQHDPVFLFDGCHVFMGLHIGQPLIQLHDLHEEFRVTVGLKGSSMNYVHYATPEGGGGRELRVPKEGGSGVVLC